MSKFDSKALASAREVMALIRRPHIGGDVQLLAKIQCLFVDAMEYAAPQSNSPVWVGVDWAEGCKPSNSPAVPDGWVMVPIRATEKMLDEFDSIIDYGAEDSNDAWSRLIAAAPKLESE